MSTTAQITAADIAEMVRHWVSTPVEGYLGSHYGADIKSLLQRPQGDTSVFSDFMQKMKTDLPILTVLPVGAINAYLVPEGNDRMTLQIDVAGTLIKVGQ